MIFGQMGDIMKMAKEMQGKLKKIKEELALAEYQGFADGVSAKVSGEMDLKELSIDPNLIAKNDKAKLEKEVKEAIGKALKQAKDEAAKKMKGMTGGLNLPGVF